MLRVAQRAHEGVALVPSRGAWALRGVRWLGHLQGQRRRGGGRPCGWGEALTVPATASAAPVPAPVPLTCPAGPFAASEIVEQGSS